MILPLLMTIDELNALNRTIYQMSEYGFAEGLNFGEIQEYIHDLQEQHTTQTVSTK